MKKLLLTLWCAGALITATAGNNIAPWGWATCADEAGSAYVLNGGNFSDAKTKTLKALGGGQTDDAQIRQAIAQNDIVILDGSNGDFVLGEYVKMASTKNKTIIGINNARLCTKFYLTAEDNAYLKNYKDANGTPLASMSSTDQYTGTLPDGTTLTCDRRAFYTKEALMKLQYQKTGTYSLPNKAGIFVIETSSENIIIRNLSLIGPGAVDIDGADLITNQGQHVWIDHCTFVDSQDGALDSKLCDWATYTYNHFYYTTRSYSHAYTCGCGWVSNHSMVLHLTFARNIWGQGCQRRLPQVDDAYIHLVNNYHNCPGNSVGMTLNSYVKALVEGNFAATGVNSPLTGSGANRQITVNGNNFSASSVGSTVTMPYEYTKISAASVPATLTGAEGAGATLGNDAAYIMANIPTVTREAAASTIYYFIDGIVGENASGLSVAKFSDGATILLNKKDKAWSKGTNVIVNGDKYTSLKVSNGAENIFTAPEGKKVISITFYSYINIKEENINFASYPVYGFRTSFWKSVGGQTFTADSEGVHILKSRDPEDPDIATFNITPANVVSFTNTGEQVCFVMEVTYENSSTGVSTIPYIQSNHKIYNLQGQETKTTRRGGLYISNGKKVIMN